jgi:hypothetical protein
MTTNTSFKFNKTLVLALWLGLSACNKENIIHVGNTFSGQYTSEYIETLPGFPDDKETIITDNRISMQTFIAWTTTAAWNLTKKEQINLHAIRTAVSLPNGKTLLQKVIPIDDLALYMNNTYGGTVGGYVCQASDVKELETLNDVYWGLRLDYPESKFAENGAGYAVIRFKSESISELYIPYCEEMGGSEPHAWPNTGGGFTASTLGSGGFPEYTFEEYNAPNEGAELYEVTPKGMEILRSVYTLGKWVTFEGDKAVSETKAASFEPTIFNGYKATFRGNEYIAYMKTEQAILASQKAVEGFTYSALGECYIMEVNKSDLSNIHAVQTLAEYKQHTLNVYGEDADFYYLSTSDTQAKEQLGLNTIEKGIYGTRITKDIKLITVLK